jgi:hypothetical protein
LKSLTQLFKHRINLTKIIFIERRKSAGDLALAAVNIDSQLNEEIRNTISSMDGIKDVYTVCI